MNGAWLYLPEVLTVLLAALCFLVGAWCCVLAADVINHHSEVDRSSSEGFPAPSDGGLWVAGASEQGWAARSCAGHVPAVQTAQRYRPACPTEPVGVGDPTPR